MATKSNLVTNSVYDGTASSAKALSSSGGTSAVKLGTSLSSTGTKAVTAPVNNNAPVPPNTLGVKISDQSVVNSGEGILTPAEIDYQKTGGSFTLNGLKPLGDTLLEPLGGTAAIKDVVTNAGETVNKVVTNGVNSITSVPSGSGSSSNITSSPINYLNADIAKHYGMNAETAYMEAMANTAHQREVADMIKAGLNPSVIYGGSGAAVNQAAESTGSGNVNGSTSGHGLLKLVADIGLLAAFKSRGLYMINSVNRAIDNIFG